MAIAIIPRLPEPKSTEKKPRQRRSKEEIVAAKADAQRRREDRAVRAAQKAQDEAIRAAQRKLVEDARTERVRAAREIALRDADRAIERIASRAPSTSARWDEERKQERKRMRAKAKELRQRHSIARSEPAIVREEREWLAANARPAIDLPEEGEPAIPGMIGFVEDIRRPVQPVVDEVPAAWNAGWVMKRILDAYRTLLMLPGATRPAGFGRAWPAYLTEFADEVGRNATGAGRTTKVIHVATVEEIERMDIVFAWPLLHFKGADRECRALFQWASRKVVNGDQRELATSFGMPPSTFRRFRLAAAETLGHRLNAAGHRPF
ncbi:hypothetical protein [Ancylobacter defluvii]|uniref:Uncharacterized protein n=1 Tax=Ancylobacter defluvii TaxID=1282440 RepID=A0A9W6NDI0_9HYPH|nr:hypothetical protein [Ancylobacter defluvii]MBS7588270.1 hypothetical protein [Ancylobacter defluvii]GLK86667.1 hypothetical protein GCM10017653_47370 [Ancylobacter defluvii]